MIQNLDDKVIIYKLKNGDVLSFDEIFKKYHKKVYYFAFSYLKNKEEAEDIVQEVFMNLWKFRAQINDNFVFSRYLFKITYNATCKVFRKHSSDNKRLEEIFQNISLEDNSTRIDVEYNSLVEATNRFIDKLPPRQRNILRLNIEYRLSTEQIAEKLNISKKTIENYLAVARRSLRKSLTDAGMLSVLFTCLFLK
jgi:RNA polymerase sigma-70 factor (family 1)